MSQLSLPSSNPSHHIPSTLACHHHVEYGLRNLQHARGANRKRMTPRYGYKVPPPYYGRVRTNQASITTLWPWKVELPGVVSTRLLWAHDFDTCFGLDCTATRREIRFFNAALPVWEFKFPGEISTPPSAAGEAILASLRSASLLQNHHHSTPWVLNGLAYITPPTPQLHYKDLWCEALAALTPLACASDTLIDWRPLLDLKISRWS